MGRVNTVSFNMFRHTHTDSSSGTIARWKVRVRQYWWSKGGGFNWTFYHNSMCFLGLMSLRQNMWKLNDFEGNEAWNGMILEVTARLVLRSNFGKIVRIWIGAVDLEPKSVGGDARAAIQARSHILSFSDLNKTPHILPTTLQWGCGEGVASAFLSFSERRRGGTVIGQCGEGLGQLSNSPVSGKSYIEGRYNPRNWACDKELKHQIVTDDYVWGFQQKTSQLEEICVLDERILNTKCAMFTASFLQLLFGSFLVCSCSWAFLFLGRSLEPWSILPQPISIQMVSSLQPPPHPDYISKTVNFDVGRPGASDRQN